MIETKPRSIYGALPNRLPHASPEPMQIESVKPTQPETLPKIKYTLEDVEIKKVEVDKDIVIRLVDTSGYQFIDIRKYYKGYPTKRGIRIRKDKFNAVKKILLEEFD